MDAGQIRLKPQRIPPFRSSSARRKSANGRPCGHVLEPRPDDPPPLFFAHLFGPGVEPGYRPIHLPKLRIVAVDELPGGFDGGLIIDAIQLNHANGSVV